MPLAIAADNHLAVLAAMILIVAAAVLSAKTRIGAIVSPVPVLILLTVGLANLGMIPAEAPVYSFTTAHIGLIAVALLVLHADVRALARVSRPLAAAFSFGLAGSMVGLAVAWAYAPDDIRDPLTILYSTVVTGGIVNMMSVGQALGTFKADASLLPAVLGGSVLIDVIYLALLGQIAKQGALRAAFDRRSGALDEEWLRAADPQAQQGETISGLEGLVVPLAIAVTLAAVGVGVARLLNLSGFGVVFTGAFAFALANAAPVWLRRYRDAPQIGMLLLFLFLVAAMAGADLRDASDKALAVAQFAAVLYAVHLIVLLGLGWLFRTPLPLLVIGSVAGVGGPSTTAAIAASYEWRALVFPGVLCAVLGLAIGTYVGLAVATLVSG